MGLTSEQANMAMVIASKISGLLSITGSSFIIRDVFKRWKKTKANQTLATTTWLVLSMSLADLGSSFFAYFLGSWMIPKDGEFPGAAGTEATCKAQAFMFGMFFGAGGLSNGTLALTYWLTICREKPERELRTRKWIVILFGFPWLYGLVFGGLGLGYVMTPSDVPMSVYCWGTIAEPGTTAFMIIGVVSTLGLSTMTILVCFSMVALMRFVYLSERRMDQFSSQRRLGQESNRNRTKTVEVTKQGILYVFAWLTVMIPMLIDTVAIAFLSSGDYSKVPLPTWFHVLFACIMPLQGLFNSVVYFRPKYASIRKRDGTSGIDAVVQMLDIEAISNISRTLRSSMKIGVPTKSNSSPNSATDKSGSTAPQVVVDLENNGLHEVVTGVDPENNESRRGQLNECQTTRASIVQFAQVDGGQNEKEVERKRDRRVSMEQFAGVISHSLGEALNELDREQNGDDEASR